MPPGTRRPLLERRQKPMGVALVPLLRQDHHIDQVRHPTLEPVAKATDPVTNLVAEDEIVLVQSGGSPIGVLLLVEQIREPGREVLVLFHFPNREFAHLVTRLREETRSRSRSNTNAIRKFLSVDMIT